MAMTCEEALANNLLIGVAEGKRATSDSGSQAGFGVMVDDIESAIMTATRDIGNLDCPEIVYQWLKDTKPFSYVVSFMNSGLEILRTANVAISGESLKMLIQSSSPSEAICGVIANIYAVITETIEIASKAAFVLFDAIDDARLRLQAATKSLVNSIITCIMNVYDMIELFLCDVIKLSLVIDWNGLQMFMSACPCICKFIAWITGCDRDEDGNDISMNAAQVILCIREKFSYLDAMQVAIGLSAVLNEYVKKYLLFMFDIVNMCIDVLFTLLITPLRDLIKKYVKLLRKKWDFTFVIDGLRSTGLDCLLIYTEEKDSDGSTYYGMSILDMIATLQSWIPCLEYPCESLGERIKNKIKKYNRDLRLDGTFWGREFECDIYATCIRIDAVSDESASEYMRRMSDQWNSIWDKFTTKKMEAKHCVDDNRLHSSGGSGGNPARAVNTMREDVGATSQDKVNPAGDAVDFIENVNSENLPNNGTRPLTWYEDGRLMEMARNIHEATMDGDEFFVALWSQYLRFIGMYRLHDVSFDELCRLASDICSLKGDFGGSSVTTFTQYSRSRLPISFEPTYRRVNYYYTSDYNPGTVGRILNGEGVTRSKNETLERYYGRLYEGLVG